MTPFMDEKSAVIQRAEYKPPRVLLMDSNYAGSSSCDNGDYATTCWYGYVQNYNY